MQNIKFYVRKMLNIYYMNNLYIKINSGEELVLLIKNKLLWEDGAEIGTWPGCVVRENGAINGT